MRGFMFRQKLVFKDPAKVSSHKPASKMEEPRFENSIGVQLKSLSVSLLSLDYRHRTDPSNAIISAICSAIA